MRPLVEDGTIDYEFLYKPKSPRSARHSPAGPVAPIPGVREHWITDYRYGHRSRSDNSASDRKTARNWHLAIEGRRLNHVTLTLRTVLTLNLNGQLVYERGWNRPTSERSACSIATEAEWGPQRGHAENGRSRCAVADQVAGTWNTVDADPRVCRFT